MIYIIILKWNFPFNNARFDSSLNNKKKNFFNFILEALDQFGKVDLSKTSYYGQPYDYKSILHYDSLAFSKNGFPTMLPKRTGKFILFINYLLNIYSFRICIYNWKC